MSMISCYVFTRSHRYCSEVEKKNFAITLLIITVEVLEVSTTEEVSTAFLLS